MSENEGVAMVQSKSTDLKRDMHNRIPANLNELKQCWKEERRSQEKVIQKQSLQVIAAKASEP